MNDPYDHADLYEIEYAEHVEDVAFYVDRARVAGGRVLELGCGTGRLTIPMARAGAEVVGVDRSGPMLAALRAKLAREPAAVRARVSVHELDYHALSPGGPITPGFALVLWPFNALHHCADLGQVEAMLARARAFARPRGRLVLDAYLPDRTLYDRDPNERFEPRTFVDPRSGERLESWEHGWWEEGPRVHHVVYVYVRPDGTERRVHLELHMFELPELRAALARAGWRIVREAQDFRGTLVGPGALKWVALAEEAGP